MMNLAYEYRQANELTCRKSLAGRRGAIPPLGLALNALWIPVTVSQHVLAYIISQR